ncbi:DMT family transporter [Deinococcus maricopensis]|uniref:EamA domain-containing protein n=1 Tax=Deinococcus maricopensis (strain DSM 21211 / LMG 22137 / NRRL B-23946 / LB-34) TaxID=709986 RepID=E8U629_DEIML|nr:DMT family transporter [Deinococcus maricopensis]ADV66518.1 protein of unknown function DUF6 transmembrane [Deinococcus maricopensis DSM 21211]
MSPHARGLLLLILVTAIWGSTFPVIKGATDTLAPPILIAWRFTVGAVTLLPLLLIRRQPRPAGTALPPRSLPRDALMLGAWLIAGYGTQTIALQTTTANRAAFFTALSVVLVPLWVTVAGRQRLGWTLGLALPLAVGGLALLSWEGGALVTGDLWALACAFTYAGFILALERTAAHHAPLPFTLAQVLAVAGFAWLWALIAAPTQLLPAHAPWGALVYLGVAATAVTTLLQTIGQRTVTATEASIIYALEPVAAVLFSFLLLGEGIGVRGLIGGALVVGATILSQWPALGGRPEIPEIHTERLD